MDGPRVEAIKAVPPAVVLTLQFQSTSIIKEQGFHATINVYFRVSENYASVLRCAEQYFEHRSGG